MRIFCFASLKFFRPTKPLISFVSSAFSPWLHTWLPIMKISYMVQQQYTKSTHPITVYPTQRKLFCWLTYITWKSPKEYILVNQTPYFLLQYLSNTIIFCSPYLLIEKHAPKAQHNFSINPSFLDRPNILIFCLSLFFKERK